MFTNVYNDFVNDKVCFIREFCTVEAQKQYKFYQRSYDYVLTNIRKLKYMKLTLRTQAASKFESYCTIL